MKTCSFLIIPLGLLAFAPGALSQTPDAAESPSAPQINISPKEDDRASGEDEIIVYGKQNWGRHDGMNAFFNGDFETAEIEFEREFKSLQRRRSAIDNAGFLTEAGQFRAESIGDATSSSAGLGGAGGGGNISQLQGRNPNSSARASGAVRSANKKKLGTSTLMDGKVTFQDFALTKYMAGLSEVKLGKISEAKKSFKSSLSYDGKNHDDLMRLGLIYLQEGDFEKAAKQLEKIDKLRRNCNKRKCSKAKSITESAVTLSNLITKKASAQ